MGSEDSITPYPYHTYAFVGYWRAEIANYDRYRESYREKMEVAVQSLVADFRPSRPSCMLACVRCGGIRRKLRLNACLSDLSGAGVDDE